MDLGNNFQILLNHLESDIFPQVLVFILNTAPFWAPIVLWKLFWGLWVEYVRASFFYNQKYVLLEIKLPKELYKSPAAMELFLMSLHDTGGEGNWYEKFWNGRTRPWFSLEMVSVEGNIKFCIWMRKGNRTRVESALYAQFPGIEIYEIEDYTKSVHFEKGKMGLWGADIQLIKDDPYPIKTYVDYGLNEDPKEEYKVDPLTPLIEFLGTVGANQQIWIQIIVRAHKGESRKPGHLFKYEDPWEINGKKIINEILKRDPTTKSSKQLSDTGFPIIPTITKGEQEIVSAIERALTKQPFDVGIRCIYISGNDNFNPANIGGMLGSFKQFNAPHLNGFRPNGKKYLAKFDYPWQDFMEIRKNIERANLLEAYKRRSFFFSPYTGKSFVLNSEALATIFHFPGSVASTPTLTRVPSKKAEPPANLPL